MKSYDYTTKRVNMSRENRAKQFAPFAPFFADFIF